MSGRAAASIITAQPPWQLPTSTGVALSAGHPVYFVIFYPDPEPGQTLADVTDAEAEFIRIVAERHPASQKPVIVGNCRAAGP